LEDQSGYLSNQYSSSDLSCLNSTQRFDENQRQCLTNSQANNSEQSVSFQSAPQSHQNGYNNLTVNVVQNQTSSSAMLPQEDTTSSRNVENLSGNVLCTSHAQQSFSDIQVTPDSYNDFQELLNSITLDPLSPSSDQFMDVTASTMSNVNDVRDLDPERNEFQNEYNQESDVPSLTVNREVISNRASSSRSTNGPVSSKEERRKRHNDNANQSYHRRKKATQAANERQESELRQEETRNRQLRDEIRQLTTQYIDLMPRLLNKRDQALNSNNVVVYQQICNMLRPLFSEFVELVTKLMILHDRASVNGYADFYRQLIEACEGFISRLNEYECSYVLRNVEIAFSFYESKKSN